MRYQAPYQATHAAGSVLRAHQEAGSQGCYSAGHRFGSWAGELAAADTALEEEEGSTVDSRLSVISR